MNLKLKKTLLNLPLTLPINVREALTSFRTTFERFTESLCTSLWHHESHIPQLTEGSDSLVLAPEWPVAHKRIPPPFHRVSLKAKFRITEIETPQLWCRSSPSLSYDLERGCKEYWEILSTPSCIPFPLAAYLSLSQAAGIRAYEQPSIWVPYGATHLIHIRAHGYLFPLRCNVRRGMKRRDSIEPVKIYLPQFIIYYDNHCYT